MSIRRKFSSSRDKGFEVTTDISLDAPFASARLKVKRAYKHIDELEGWLRNIIKGNIDTVIAHKQAHPDEVDSTVMVRRPDGYSIETKLMIGDAAHNLRSALDHVAYTIVLAGRKDDPTMVYFPMQDSRQALIGSRDYGFIERVAPEAALVIADVIRPYKTGGDNRFWGLNQLDRIDKHRLLISSVLEAHSGAIAIKPEHEDDPPPIGPGPIYIVGARTTHPDGTVVDNRRPTRPGSPAYIHNQSNGYPTLKIVFGEGGAFEKQPVIPTLRQLAELVSGVIDTLEPLCFGEKP